MDNFGTLDFSGEEETGLLTLYSKAMESQSADPILKDPMAEAIVARIDPILQQKDGLWPGNCVPGCGSSLECPSGPAQQEI